ncbi:MAG TPA: terpene synthase family protein [Ktedonobacterales bacterium]|nr:terpene synthase family protein [Ktedonobacterales bacterium]
MPDTPTSRRTTHAAPTATPTAPASHVQPTPVFDWRALVARSQPGDATTSQRAQAARLGAATAELTTWAEQFGLLTAYVRPSAMFAVVCTPPDAPDDLTRSLAQLILWYYSFDTTLDSQPLERIGDPAWVDAMISASVAPLLSDLRLSAVRRLGWLASAVTDVAPEEPAITARLSAALADWRETTFAPWERMAPHLLVRQFWRQTLAEQLADAATAMRQELTWTSAWRADRLVAPTMADYLRTAIRTTGVHPMLTLVCHASGQAPAIWPQRRPLLNAAARVIRLANDASSAEADLTDQNITAVTTALLRLPADRARRTTTMFATTEVSGGRGAPGLPEQALDRARAQVARRLDAAIVAFARRLATQPEGPDADYLRYTVAWALAHYGQG